MSEAAHITDTETDRVTVDRLTHEQLEAHLSGIRERRKRAVEAVKRARTLEAAFQIDKARKQYIKQIGIAEKEVKRLDALIEKLEERVVKLQTMVLEAGGDVSVFFAPDRPTPPIDDPSEDS